MSRFLILLCWISLLMSSCGNKTQYKFQNPKLPIDERVADLVSLLTIEEKISQMINNAPAIERLGIPAYN